MLGHEINADCTDFIRFDYCTVQSIWNSDHDYANIKETSLHEGVVQSRMESSFICMQTSIMQKSRGKMGVLWDHCVAALGSQTCRKCSQPLPALVKIENMMQQATIAEVYLNG